MDQHIKSILLLAGAIALLVGVRDAQYLHAAAPAGTSGSGLPTGAQIDPGPTPSPTPGSDSGQITTVESNQTGQVAPILVEPGGDVDPESIPSPEERDAVLDWVNRGPPILSGRDRWVGEGPAPGTESVMGHEEEHDHILDRVDRGAPLLPEQDKETSEGPTPTTGSDLRHREEQDSTPTKTNRGAPLLPERDKETSEGREPETDSETEQRSSPDRILIQIIETLLNWCQELFA
jgi:hypothetical protein